MQEIKDKLKKFIDRHADTHERFWDNEGNAETMPFNILVCDTPFTRALKLRKKALNIEMAKENAAKMLLKEEK